MSNAVAARHRSRNLRWQGKRLVRNLRSDRDGVSVDWAVHRATTHAGQPVVVKVQHPGIERRIINDLKIIGKLAEIAEHQSIRLRQYRPVQTTREFRRTLMQELDFDRELRRD